MAIRAGYAAWSVAGAAALQSVPGRGARSGFSSSITPETSGLARMTKPALRASASMRALLANVSPTMRSTPSAEARQTSLPSISFASPLPCQAAALHEHLCHQGDVVGVVDMRESLQQLGRQIAHRAHEPVVAGCAGEGAEESARQVLVLREHGADDDALTCAKPHHVDQVGGVAM